MHNFAYGLLPFLDLSVWGAVLPHSLGLQWGMGLDEFRKSGTPIEEEWMVWNHATAVRIGKTDKLPSDTGSFILVFDQQFGLVKSHWAGQLIQRDENGAKGVQAFEKLKLEISDHFGDPRQSNEEFSVKLQGFHGSFYQCLQDETCGKWEALWELEEGGAIILELVGIDPGMGFVQMSIQGPNLDMALKRAHLGIHDVPEHEI